MPFAILHLPPEPIQPDEGERRAAYRTGLRVTFDEKRQEVMAGGKVFKY